MSFFISDAVAEAAAGQPQGAGLDFLIMVVLFFAIMYFMIIRPQSKRAKEHKKMVEELRKGDEVATQGGIMGKITNVGEEGISLEISEGVEVKVQSAAITAVLPKGTLKKS
jgi:preprotein translocase subunit YajC